MFTILGFAPHNKIRLPYGHTQQGWFLQDGQTWDLKFLQTLTHILDHRTTNCTIFMLQFSNTICLEVHSFISNSMYKIPNIYSRPPLHLLTAQNDISQKWHFLIFLRVALVIDPLFSLICQDKTFQILQVQWLWGCSG